MATTLCGIVTVLLTLTADATLGPKCQPTYPAAPGWTRVECRGQYGVQDLSQLSIVNMTRLLLQLHSPIQEALDFQRFTKLNYLQIQADDIQTLLPNISGLDRLTNLNLSSNRIHYLPDLTHFLHLEELDLSNNSLTQVDFQLTPPTLRFINLHSNHIEMHSNVTLPTSLEHLDLSGNHMTSMQPIYSETLVRLNLSGNNISELSFLLSLITVEELDLSINNIIELKDDDFSAMSSLVRLDLSRNFIKSLKEKSFSGLNRLQIIDLSHNLLQSITPGTFQYLSNLLWLNLANNTNLANLDAVEDSSILLGAGQKLQTVDASRTNLTKIPNTLTSSIRNLYLSCNRISTIRCGDLDSFLLLQFLDLASNNISIIEDDAIGRLELLFYLLLSENSLSVIPHSLPDNLLVLDLDHNHIKNLTAIDFYGLPKLRTLRLAWNRITNIQDGAFGQLSSLQNLDLSGNPMKILSGSTFIGPRRLINLSLASLTSILPTNDTLSFPVPESTYLQVLNLENSPGLVNQLMNDVAALSMFRHLNVLNLAYSRISSIRRDLINFFPRLEVLDLRGNSFNCTDVLWLSNWLRRMRDDPTPDESRLQRLEETYTLQDNHTDFDITQNTATYTYRLKSSPPETQPKCGYPDNLIGVSLYQLQGPTTISPPKTTTPKPKYGRSYFNIRKPYDHEFYQNDFPSPDHKDLLTKTPSTEKRQMKQVNSTDLSNLSAKPITSTVHQIPTDAPLLVTKSDSIKAEFLRSDNKINERNKTNEFVDSKNKNSSTVKQSDIVSVFSPLDVALHEIDKQTNNPDTLSVSSPQRISIEEDLDESKDVLDEEDDDDLGEERYTHHPGLVVFLVAAGVLGVTALAMRASQRRQNRNGYAQQQDIEVRSLDLSGQELW